MTGSCLRSRTSTTGVEADGRKSQSAGSAAIRLSSSVASCLAMLDFAACRIAAGRRLSASKSAARPSACLESAGDERENESGEEPYRAMGRAP